MKVCLPNETITVKYKTLSKRLLATVEYDENPDHPRTCKTSHLVSWRQAANA